MGVKAATTKDKPSRATIARRKNARERRSRILAEGGRRLELLLEKQAARALDRLEKIRGDNATTIITALLRGASDYRRGP